MKMLKKIISLSLSGVMMAGCMPQLTLNAAAEAPASPDEINFALGKPVTAATGVNPLFPDKVEKNITDGDYATYWEGVYDNAALKTDTLILDMQEEHTVERIKTYWGNGYPRRIKVSTSTDNVSYKTKQYSYNGTGTDIILDAPVSCRYIKLELESIPDAEIQGYALHELEVYGPRTEAAISSVKASSEYSPAQREAGESTVDFGTEYVIDRVELKWDEDMYNGCYLQGSVDGKNWNDIDYTTDRSKEHTFRFKPQKLRCIRVISEEPRSSAIAPASIEAYCDSNYALYSKVFTDHDVPQDPNKHIPNINDGSDASRWECGSTDDAAVWYDMGTSVDVSNIRLDFWQDMAKTIKVSVSGDGSSWQEKQTFANDDNTVSEARKNQHAVFETPVENTAGRFIKFDLHKEQPLSKAYYSAWEFEVYTDMNFAEGKEIISGLTNVESSPRTADAVLSEDNSYWMSDYSDDESITFELEQAEPIYNIDIDWYDAYASDYLIQFSENGTDYKTVFKADDRLGGSESITVAPRMAKYVRIQGLKRGTSLGYGIRHVKLYKDTEKAAELTAALLDPLSEQCFKESLDTASASDEEISSWLGSQKADGGWWLDDPSDPDFINYDPALDEIVSDWTEMYKHINRIREMLCAYHNKNSRYYNSQEVVDAADKGIEFWFEVRKPYQKSNWWHNQLGIQQVYRKIALLGQFVIKEKNLNYITGVNPTTNIAGNLLPFVSDHHTGANKAWFAENTIYRGLLTQDASNVMRGWSALLSTVYENDPDNPESDGLQLDGSFTQHGTLLYSNGYGRVFYTLIAQWGYYFRDTPLQFPADKLNIIGNAFINGNRWMQRYETLDPHSMGREFIRMGREADLSAVPYKQVLRQLQAIIPDKADTFGDIIDFIDRKRDDPGVTGNKMFYITDFMTHQRDDYYMSVKMQSNGVKGSETTNQENNLGGYLSMGSTFIMNDGYEYVDETDPDNKRYAYPAWDWSLIPGTTAPRFECTTEYGMNMNNDFVGGATDGTYGVAGMDAYKAYELSSGSYKGVQTLSAKKAYFMFDNETVALGTGIKCNGHYDVTTALNQSLLKGDVYVDGEKLERTAGSNVDERDGNTSEHEANYKPELDKGYIVDDAVKKTGVSKVWHDNIGYVFPDPTDVEVKDGAQTGSWSRFTVDQSLPQGSVTEDIFSLRINHGTKPGNNGNAEGEYEYIILPAADKNEVDAYNAEEHIEIIANSASMQAVRQKELGVTGVVFYEPGSIDIKGSTLSVDKPCMLLAKETENGLEVSVSNAAEPGVVVNAVYRNSSGEEREVFELPAQRGYLGDSVTKTIPYPDGDSTSVEIKDFSIRTAEGREATGFANGTSVSVSATLANSFDTAKPAAVIGALYEQQRNDDGSLDYKFISAVPVEASVEAGSEGTELHADISVPNDDKLYVVKGMLWNSISGAKPLHDAISAVTLMEGLERVNDLSAQSDIDRNTLRWSAPYAQAESYNIYKLDENGDEQLIGASDTTEFVDDQDVHTVDYLTDEQIEAGETAPTYDYVVRAVINGRESEEEAKISVKAIETAKIVFNGLKYDENGEPVLGTVTTKADPAATSETVTIDNVQLPDYTEHGVTLLGVHTRIEGIDPFAGLRFPDIKDSGDLGALAMTNNAADTIDGMFQNPNSDYAVADDFVGDDDRHLIVYITYLDNYDDRPHEGRYSLICWGSTLDGRKEIGRTQRINENQWKTVAYEINDARFDEKSINNANNVMPKADLRIEKAGSDLLIHSIEVRNIDREAREAQK